jgi:hypothetical protein
MEDCWQAVLQKFFKVILVFQNMVGPGEVDDELEPETAEECSKYGEVQKVVIYEVIVTFYLVYLQYFDKTLSQITYYYNIQLLLAYCKAKHFIFCLYFFEFSLQIPEGVSDDEAVRIFVEFKKIDSAIKGNLYKYPLCFSK